MSGKHNFTLESGDPRRDMPRKIIIGRQESETVAHVALKLLGFLLFFRQRLQMETNLHTDNIPFVPDLVELDYELRPVLWVECGECNLNKLDKLAVKVPEAELWVLRRSRAAAEELLRGMAKQELRRNRYNIVGFESEVFEELCGLVSSRNHVVWVKGGFEPPGMEFDFNGLWFDLPFQHWKF